MAQEDELAPEDMAHDGWRKSVAVSMVRTFLFSAIVVGVTGFASSFELTPSQYLVTAVISAAVWLVFFVLYYRWMAIRIVNSTHPVVPGIETLIVGTVIFLTIFANVYHLVSLGSPNAFSEVLSLFDSYYFAVTILATVGFGDITPTAVISRSFVMAQMLMDLGILAVGVRIVTTAIKRATASRKSSAEPAGPVQ